MTGPERPDPAWSAACAEAEAAYAEATRRTERSDSAVAMLDVETAALLSELAAWRLRDDSSPQPGVRAAAHGALRRIDRMLADLFAARAALMAEIRQSDDAAMARTEALLDELHRRRRADGSEK